MKPDTGPGDDPAASVPGSGSGLSARRLDAVEPAHLKVPGDTSHAMYRYAPPPGFEGFLERFWIPVWSVPPGEQVPQKVLQYPVCLIVITAGYARFYGVASGLSTTTLTGDGWAVGVMLAPAAGYLLVGGAASGGGAAGGDVAAGSVADYTDRFVDVPEILGDAGRVLADRVRAAMAPDPHSERGHHAAMEAYVSQLRRFLPVDAEGETVNRLVRYVESGRDVLRVAQVCEAFELGERSLQRLVHRRLGLTPKWLIQRRRLREAADLLRRGETTATEVAAVLGYADQAHFIRDFSAVTGLTPGRFAAGHG